MVIASVTDMKIVVALILTVFLLGAWGISPAKGEGINPWADLQRLPDEELSSLKGQGEGGIVIQDATSQRVILWDEVERSIKGSNISTGEGNVQANVLMIPGW